MIKQMSVSGILRKLKDLDQLEKRLRQLKNPSEVLLKQIDQERNQLMGVDDAPNSNLKK